VSNTKKALRKCVRKFGKLRLRCGSEDEGSECAGPQSERRSHRVEPDSNTNTPDYTNFVTNKMAALLTDNMPFQSFVNPSLEIRLFHNYLIFSAGRPPVTLTRTHSLPTLIRNCPKPASPVRPVSYNVHEIMGVEKETEKPRGLPQVGSGYWPHRNRRAVRSLSCGDFRVEIRDG
jgi:hypothetical protein